MKRNAPVRRDWAEAREKVDEEGKCRGCGRNPYYARLEAAHIVGREHDQESACRTCGGDGCSNCNGYGVVIYVNPLDIVPLCGPATTSSTCHGKQHDHLLDLLPLLTAAEQVRAVALVGSIAGAYVKLAGRLPGSQEEALSAAGAAPRDVQHWSEADLGLYPATPSPPPEE